MLRQTIHFTCSHCHADLEMKPDRLMAYCPYCGEKLVIDIGQMREIPDGMKGTEDEPPDNLPETEQGQDENGPKADGSPDDRYPKWYDPPLHDHPEWNITRLWFIPVSLLFVLITGGAALVVLIPLVIYFYFSNNK